MSQPAAWGWRRRAADALERVGLARPALAVYQGTLGLKGALTRAPAGADDGVPMPPARLRARAGPAHADPRYFFESGARHVELASALLADHGVGLAECLPILDFGCGCGRVLRHLGHLDGPLHGCDIDPAMVAWCRANLSFADVEDTRLEPPLPYPSGMFGLAYAFSVVTHLPEALQVAWIDELGRVLRPGGYLLVSTLGVEYAGLQRLTADERAVLEEHGLVVLFERHPGSNLCSAYHSPAYVERSLARDLEYVGFAPAADLARHDLHLLRKPGP